VRKPVIAAAVGISKAFFRFIGDVEVKCVKITLVVVADGGSKGDGGQRLGAEKTVVPFEGSRCLNLVACA
jgi:hypothetical protein